MPLPELQDVVAELSIRDAADIPVDAHQLIALCAPRPTFISYGMAATRVDRREVRHSQPVQPLGIVPFRPTPGDYAVLQVQPDSDVFTVPFAGFFDENWEIKTRLEEENSCKVRGLSPCRSTNTNVEGADTASRRSFG